MERISGMSEGGVVRISESWGGVVRISESWGGVARISGWKGKWNRKKFKIN